MFSAPAVDAMHSRLQDMAGRLDVPFTRRPHAPSTKPALAVSELARREGRLDAWRTLAMDAHWAEGRDIEDRAVLAELAERAGLDADAAIAWLDDPEVPAVLQAQRAEAHRWGVTGIPTWFLLPTGWTPGEPLAARGPRPVRVVGCQLPGVVDGAAVQAGATPRAP